MYSIINDLGNLNYLKVFRASREIRFLYEKHGREISENEIFKIASFMETFYDILLKEGEKVVNDLLNILYRYFPAMLASKNPSRNGPDDYMFMDSQVIRFKKLEYSSLENNLGDLAVQMIKTAAKQERQGFDDIKKEIERIDFGYEKRLKGKAIMKKSIVNEKPQYYKSYFYTEAPYIIELKDDKDNPTEYVLIKGWGPKEIHQLNKILKKILKDESVQYIPPTSGFNV